MARRQGEDTRQQVERHVAGGQIEEAFELLVSRKWVPQGSGKSSTLPTNLSIFANLGDGRVILTSPNGTKWAWEYPPKYGLIDLDRMVKDHPEGGTHRAMMALLANGTLSDANDLSQGKNRQPELHRSGWTILLETPMGNVTLRYNWMETDLILSYPGRKTLLLDSLVKAGKSDVLVKVATDFVLRHWCQLMFLPELPLTARDAYQFLLGMPLDQLYTLLTIELGDVALPQAIQLSPDWLMSVLHVTPSLAVASDAVGFVQWAKYYSPMLEQGGRVWVDHTEHISDGLVYWTVQDGVPVKLPYGYGTNTYVHTLPFSFHSDTQPEAPNAHADVVFPYRDRFIELAVGIAGQMGGVTAITIDYGFVHVPESLESAGYTDITWLKGVPGTRTGYNEEIVRATKLGETVYLVSGNSMVPWATIRRVTDVGKFPYKTLQELLTY